MNKWTTISSETLVDSKWVKVNKNKVKLPNDIVIDDFYTVSWQDAAAIVALTPDNEVILKKEYRYTYDQDLIEIPAGGFEPGETDGLAVARRELLEETGYTSDEWTYLGATVESSSKLTNHMHIYMATGCRKVADQNLDSTEDIEVMVVPMNKAVEMIMSNEICCNSSVHGIMKAFYMTNNKNNN